MSHFGNYKCKRKYHFIYKTTNLINGRYYFGMHSTDNLDDDYLGSGDNLWKSIRKYGKKNFKREIIEFCKNRKELVEKEREIVNLNELSKKECLNMRVGGEGGLPHFNNKEEERQWHIKGAIATNKIRTKYFQKKYKEDKKFKAKMVKSWSNAQKKRYKTQNNPMKDRKHSEESRKKMSISQSGEKNSQFGTIWITNGVENRKTKNKIPKGWAQGRTWNKIG